MPLRRTHLDYDWWFRASDLGKGGASVIAVPIWSLVLLTAVPTAWMFRTDCKRRRGERAGLCATCGYDLRGLPGDRACPECGSQSD
jgi:hypothetical protein